MADKRLTQGRALRFFQIILILAAGWVAGRLPAMIADNEQEKQTLAAALGVAPMTANPAQDMSASPPSADQAIAAADEARLVAEIAARVAVDVADRTVARLLAAGWGPGGGAPAQLAAAPGMPAQTVVRLVHETAPGLHGAPVASGWSLPAAPQPGGNMAVPESAIASTGSTKTPPTPSASAADPSDPRLISAHAVATQGYEALQTGDRRRAVALLDEAARMAPGTEAARQWQADSAQLTKRWSLAGYVLSRSGSMQDPLAASPVLGGAQAGAAIGYVLDPLADTRVSVIGRITSAMGDRGSLERDTAEAAIGLRVQPSRDLPLAIDIERRIALGTYARNAWAARISGGTEQNIRAIGRQWRWQGYGEAGVVGLKNSSWYAGGQTVLATPMVDLGRVSVETGGGVWGATQRDFGMTVSRLDFGPSAQFRIQPWAFYTQLDYRVKAAGNARPGSGAVITVGGEF